MKKNKSKPKSDPQEFSRKAILDPVQISFLRELKILCGRYEAGLENCVVTFPDSQSYAVELNPETKNLVYAYWERAVI